MTDDTRGSAAGARGSAAGARGSAAGARGSADPWLSAGEQRTWRSYLDATRLLLASLDQQLQTESGMSLADYDVLVQLSEAPERQLRMSDLADATLFSRSRVSHAVRRLETLGWVRRVECPSDRRGTFAQLTGAGFERLADAAPGHAETVRRHVFDPLGPSRARELGEIGAILRDHLA